MNPEETFHVQPYIENVGAVPEPAIAAHILFPINRSGRLDKSMASGNL